MADRYYVLQRFDGYIGTDAVLPYTAVTIDTTDFGGELTDNYTCILDITVLSVRRAPGSTSGGAAMISIAFGRSNGTTYDFGDTSLVKVGTPAVTAIAGNVSVNNFIIQITPQHAQPTQHQVIIEAKAFKPYFT